VRLKRQKNLTAKQQVRLRDLLRYNLQTVRSYLLKEDSQQFWTYNSPAWAGKLLDFWCHQVVRSRIEAMKKLARTLRDHRELIAELFHGAQGVFQRCPRGPQQQGQGRHEKLLRLPHLPRSRTRLVSLTCQAPRAYSHPQILLTSRNSRKCAHPSCRCHARADSSYCSTYSEGEAKTVQLRAW
jgi:Transposase